MFHLLLRANEKMQPYKTKEESALQMDPIHPKKE